MRPKDGLGLLRGHSGFDRLARRDILGVLLDQLTVGRHGVVHNGLKGRASQVGRQGLGLRKTRLFDDKEVVRNAKESVHGSRHCCCRGRGLD